VHHNYLTTNAAPVPDDKVFRPASHLRVNYSCLESWIRKFFVHNDRGQS